ncbi:ribonuclease D [Pontibaca methylaminivorans]|uniref:Ribonuclease D n=1 Tax=Pontibaca methylaminivorans TaxID=515897 RepID=A0A1R3WZ58_9RHOB|nr:ribonuclease D [Pontibaca methylaminivorans]SIT83557.1 ribonuclease D [Pontibaca methylaminivorans]
MRTITTTDDLSAFCTQARTQDYVTVDTEFMRERTYYSKLCLVQLAMPGSAGDAVLVDPLADGIRLDPLYELFRDENVVKVFHAARQDLEIFWVDADVLPRPLFDTQVAAMVCGFGDQVSYETLVRRIAHEKVDKSSRFTDWSRRPLREAQKVYALADVTHLRDIYEWLAMELERSGRSRWVAEELGSLTDPETYRTRPEDAWRRIKTRNHTPRFLAIVRELAAFRERHAQEKDIPRSRVMKDDALLEIAAAKPRTPADLGGLRLLLREARRGEIAEGILAAVERGMACPPEDLPKDEAVKERLQVNPALADLLRVLLKSKTESSGVAARLIAPSSDLDAIAAGKRDIPALSGWRREVFGADALRLCEGEIALAANGNAVQVVQL